MVGVEERRSEREGQVRRRCSRENEKQTRMHTYKTNVCMTERKTE